MIDISKRFPGVQALRSVNLTVFPGEVHILVGENGAGKTTLMNILGGVFPPDEGQIRLLGRAVHLTSPAAAMRLGIAFVHQEPIVVDSLSVMENLFLTREPRTAIGLIDTQAMRRRAGEILAQLGLDLDPGRPAAGASLVQRHLIEIARALMFDARLIVMDEPTSSLTPGEIAVLFRTVRAITRRGTAVIYISHRLEEAFAIGNRVTVLRDGQHVATLPVGDLTERDVIRLMIGRDLQERYPYQSGGPCQEVLVLEQCRLGDVGPVDLTLHAGELVGLFGLVGSGRTSVLEALGGVRRPTSGQIRLDARSLRFRSPRDAIARGVAYIPSDRERRGLFLNLSMGHNLSVSHLGAISRLGFIRRAFEKAHVTRVAEEVGVVPRLPWLAASGFSGGNKQKIVIGRWMGHSLRAVLLDEPTRGVDVRSRSDLYDLMNRLKRRGVAVLFATSELDEALGIADRVVVMSRGRISGEFGRGAAHREQILAAAFGRSV